MPIFQDPDRQRFYDLWSDDHASHEQPDHPSPWNGHNEDSWTFNRGQNGIFRPERRVADLHLPQLHTGDRAELIQYIKSADTSIWGHDGMPTDPYHPHTADEDVHMEERPSQESNPMYEFHTNGMKGEELELASPAEIQRPRSALHSGDFREGTAQLPGQEQPQSPIPKPTATSHFPHLSSSPTTPWFNPLEFQTPLRRQHSSTHPPGTQPRTVSRARAPSAGSFSSSYVLKAPTSPLVHQANNTDLDFSPRADVHGLSESLEKANRRRTLPPETFRHLQSSPAARSAAINFRAIHPSRTRGESLSYHAHHHLPQRSLTSTYSLQLASSVQAPAWRARRPSLSSEASSKTQAPLVGSYEESILRGRMSMNPSKPLDFTAQIGVLGRGKCKANLRCPPHVSIPFPAVFYSYPTSGSGRSISDDNPSPYVGLIDLDNALPKNDRSTNRRRKRHHSPAAARNDPIFEDPAAPKFTEPEALRIREKKNRRAESPKCPPGGCYRIPQQGQLQVVIKNPNKTAVKLFLIPYDLSDMEPGNKTFIRQRSYSASPTIDMPLTARKNYGTDRPEASLNASEDPKDKPVLRYLIHLNICCPAKGRFYLHSSIRVVFANRVPDGKETLRNEIQLPDPRYMPYKPNRESNLTHVNTKLATEKASRRFLPLDHEKSKNHHAASSDARQMEIALPASADKIGFNTDSLHGNSYISQREPHPFQSIPSVSKSPLGWNDPELLDSPGSQHDAESAMYHKLSKGDVGYGGSPFGSHGSSEAGEGLLAKRLRGLDVQMHDISDSR